MTTTPLTPAPLSPTPLQDDPLRAKVRQRGVGRGSRTWRYGGGILAIVLAVLVFIVPFLFIVLTAAKTQQESSLLGFTLPTQWVFLENLQEVVSARNFVLLRAFANSAILTIVSVTVMVVLAAMVGYVLQRRRSKWNPLVNGFVLAGLIIPPAVVPTIWVLQGLELFKTLPGLIAVHVAFGLSFCILLFRAFVSTIPRELDEAATIDGAGPFRLFFTVVLPLLKPVIVTVIVVQAVTVFNDFTYALYFLPGDDNATVQLTLYNFSSQSVSSWNLLFMDVLLITIPPLVMYIFFNRQIVAGMTSGAVKG
ncbi:carbohydrate ABC transporter membrane protein 2 (CUT1 family) [Rathayibacter sp. PhB93]|nr:carbohydrate ABC transporter membrane protein 2 (CUT1 family) [Rathayibacter sp. PhB186]ROQ04314.1 carbohydrate ABC transporter membrane protein 2 (CUT1 family) [Rathayibacter sp. PhB93]ROS49819.1 carbohydrate ABC transporter membrane protein 2 (CUT1 family) [Rathayibacter sp. PhB185]TCL80114.1 carbohydrate ABC transporter membrane protein 2 (CUT1 family) [Rathayibacter sp. PhB192]TCM25555.1 carbohydrate ABC transporter membrane protein 2 (CUT1 family) [Rathayibacter sp. PhB179]TDQ13151.1 c